MLGVVLIILSCKKDTKNNLEDESKLPYYPRVGSFRSLTMPTVENEMLVFDDQGHLSDYIDYLDLIIMDEPQSEQDTDNDTFEIDEKLQLVEDQIGFNSLRSIECSEFESLNAYGFETLDDIPEEPLLASSSIKSCLNEYYEVKIGDDIWVYFNLGYTIQIVGGDINIRNIIRDLRPEYTNSFPICLISIEDIKIFGNEEVVCQIPNVTNGNTNSNSQLDTNFVSWGNHFPYQCLPFNFKFSASLQVDVEDPDTNLLPIVSDVLSSQAQYSWDFGDGTTIQSGQSSEDHIFNSTGTYSAKVTITYSGTYGNHTEVLTYNVIVSGQTCAAREFDENTGQVSINSSVAYLRRSQGKIFGGSLFNDKIVTYTKSYLKINGTWKYRKVDRLATIMTGNYKNSSCSNISVTKAVWPYNSKCAEVTQVAEGYRIYNDDLHIDSRLWHNSVYNQSLKDLPTVCQ
jgi:hypothetical protein